MTRTIARIASEKQSALIGSLILERVTEGLTGPDGDALAAYLNGDGVSSSEASALITALFAAPRVPRAKSTTAGPSTAEVPAGRYALDAGDGNLDFVKVDRPDKGKWAGYVFAKRLVGAPGDFREIRLSRADAARMLDAIAADTFHDVYTDEVDGEVTEQRLTGPDAAAVRFSRRFVCCAACLSPLSDKRSRARGLGPVCASRV